MGEVAREGWRHRQPQNKKEGRTEPETGHAIKGISPNKSNIQEQEPTLFAEDGADSTQRRLARDPSEPARHGL